MTPRQGMQWVAASLTLIAGAACADARPIRLTAGRSDTVVVNSRGAVVIPVRLVDAGGRERRASGVSLQVLSGSSVALDDDGSASCSGRGDAVLEATRGQLSTKFTVACRPIAGVRLGRPVVLTQGGSPAALHAPVVGPDGEDVDMIASRVSVRDTLIVTFRDGLLHPRSRGVTYVEIEAGDCAVPVRVEVVEPVAESEAMQPYQQYVESLDMSPGELRDWHLAPGRYEITLIGDTGTSPRLRLASYQMNCGHFPQADQQYLCIAKERAVAIVQHTGEAGRGRSATGTLVVLRRTDPTDEPRPRRGLSVYGCPTLLR